MCVLGGVVIKKEGSDEPYILYHMTGVLTSVHHSIELHRHADAACAVSGEVQSRVLPAICQEDNKLLSCFVLALVKKKKSHKLKCEKAYKRLPVAQNTSFKNLLKNISLKSPVSLTEKQFACSIR